MPGTSPRRTIKRATIQRFRLLPCTANQRGHAMLTFDLSAEQEFNPVRHVEKILGVIGEGDVTVACWAPGQTSPNHLHPNATEIYFCFSGGGVMRTPSGEVPVKPGSFVVHPRGELHE